MATRIDFCSLDAAGELMIFIRDHWAAGHVLARSREVLDWQHRNEADGRYNFLLARDDSGSIVGVLGFIPSSRYDASLAGSDETVWLALWKVVEGCSAGLGLMLLRELNARLRPKWIGAAGINAEVRVIYNAMGYRTGRLTRFYRLSENVTEHRLAILPPDWPAQPSPPGQTELRLLTGQDFWSATSNLELDASNQAPRKTRASFHERYLSHPYYDYRVYLAEADNTAALLATRLCRQGNASALRIVDLLGSPAPLAGCGPAFNALLSEAGAEYVDFYCSGADQELETAGFRRLENDAALILPSYFEPFERRNVDVLYSIKGPGDRLVICKGDGDQDRPSLLCDGPG